MQKPLELKKRKWCYIMHPICYEISCDLCGGANTTWSEYEGLIWCYDCEKDTRGNGGIFDGPVPLGACEVLGISFDRFDIETGERLYMIVGKDKVTWTPEPPT